MKRLFLIAYFMLLLPVSFWAQSEVVVLTPVDEQDVENADQYYKIFLAGTIDMGKSVDWQKNTAEWFRQKESGKYMLFNPRRGKGLSGEMSDFEHQVNWELEHLEKADLIIMNILGSSKSPISLLEMGIYMQSGKMHIICEPDYYRYDNVRITCKRYGVPLYHSLDDYLKEFER